MKAKIFVLIVLVFGLIAWTQERVIRGKVTDSSGSPLAGVSVSVKGTQIGVQTNALGEYSIRAFTGTKLVFSFIGFQTKEVKISKSDTVNVVLREDSMALEEVVETDFFDKVKIRGLYSAPSATKMEYEMKSTYNYPQQPNTEEYASQNENIFHDAQKEPLTTFSIDVDRASYTNIRRFINNGEMPPKDAVRIEEMLNYFDYDYPQPTNNDPFSITTEISDSPWNKGLKLLHIGLQGKKIPTENLPASNLVFLIDVSGSMDSPNKLPLLRQGFKLLTDQLRAEDKVSIVVYAGAAGLVLPATSGKEKTKIKEALDKLQAGGSTAGGEGIRLAYKTATENFIKDGNNRVILATDGDFNVGVSSEKELENLIENQRKTGVFLSVLGFGMGNYKDSKMEVLADKGNGNYGYIDNLQEAQKTFVTEFGGTLFTIAKDVKLQLDFNPKFVKAYRLIGYENRMLKNEDFNNDKKDAGELGSGHTVTALYEIIPVGMKSNYFAIDKSKYQNEKETASGNSNEVLTIKFRYKKPDEDVSKLIEKVVLDQHTSFEKTSDNFRWSASVAEFGLLLRDSEYRGESNYDEIIRNAQKARGKDEEGYRAEFIKLVKLAKGLDEER